MLVVHTLAGLPHKRGYPYPTMILLMGMWISFTKKPMKPCKPEPPRVGGEFGLSLASRRGVWARQRLADGRGGERTMIPKPTSVAAAVFMNSAQAEQAASTHRRPPGRCVESVGSEQGGRGTGGRGGARTLPVGLRALRQ